MDRLNGIPLSQPSKELIRDLYVYISFFFYLHTNILYYNDFNENSKFVLKVFRLWKKTMKTLTKKLIILLLRIEGQSYFRKVNNRICYICIFYLEKKT